MSTSEAIDFTAEKVTAGIYGIGNTLTGNIHIGDIQYVAANHLLALRHLRPHREDMADVPSGLDKLYKKLNEMRLLILQAPSGWGANYVAEILCQEAIKKTREKPEYARRSDELYECSSDASAGALINEIRQRTGDLAVRDRPVIIHNAQAKRFEVDKLGELVKLAQECNLHFLLLSEGEWGEAYNQFAKVDLEKALPYTTDDLLGWLIALLNDIGADKLRPYLKDAAISRIDAGTKLESGKPLSVIAAKLNEPELLRTFPQELLAEAQKTDDDSRRSIDDILNDLGKRPDLRWKRWFDELPEESRYVVLALSLTDELPPETFWAIYEQLAGSVWRERQVTLTMSDYHSVQADLQKYIVASTIGRETSIRFADPSIRPEIIKYAAQKYRRSLVQALPILADIVAGAAQTQLTGLGSVAGRLRTLDILGSDLAPVHITYNRYNRLRVRLINSIVLIRSYEPTTTEHLLLSWAEGISNKSEGDSERAEANRRLRSAFSDTLILMYQSDVEQQRDSIELAHHWYRDYQPDLLAMSGGQRGFINDYAPIEKRRARVRQGLVEALCKLTLVVDKHDFGIYDDAVKILKRVPEAPIKEPASIGTMIASFAWDASSEVRQHLAYACTFLRGRYHSYFEALIRLLASDWNEDVRWETASELARLYRTNSIYLYLTNDLLDQQHELINRAISQDDHYLRFEAKAAEGLIRDASYPLHMWTASLAMLMIGQFDSNVMTVYLHMYLRNEATMQFKAFTDVLRRILLGIKNVPTQQQPSIFKQILLDRNGDNTASPAARALNEIYADLEIRLPLSDDEKERMDEVFNPREYLHREELGSA